MADWLATYDNNGKEITATLTAVNQQQADDVAERFRKLLERTANNPFQLSKDENRLTPGSVKLVTTLRVTYQRINNLLG